MVERLWPERLDEELASNRRGLPFVVDLVDIGLTLRACEHFEGFAEVLSRVKKRQKGARSELRIAAALLQLGYRPVLEPRVKGKRLDTLISDQGNDIYFEVTAPQHSEGVRQALEGMNTLASSLTEQNPGTNIDVYLLSDPVPHAVQALLDYVHSLTSPSSETVHELQGIAFVRYEVYRAEVTAFQPINEHVGDASLVVAGARRQKEQDARASVQLPFTDERAANLMSRELSHFSAEEINVLVVQVSQVIGGMKGRVPLIQRRFQPRIDRRCGAVVLVETLLQGNGMGLESTVLENPHAHRRPPATLLKGLGNLPNWWGS